MGDAMVLLAQVSDLHIDGGEERTARAERVMGYLAALPRPVDAVLVTGDVADHGQPAEYQTARELLGWPAPVLACPGNHDRRGSFRRVLLVDPGGEGPVNQVHRLDGVTVLLCDSTVPGQDGGYLDDQTIGWLDAALAAAAGSPTSCAGTTTSWPCSAGTLTPRPVPGSPAASCWSPRGVASTLLLPAERPTGDALDGDAPAAIAFHLLD